MALRSSLTHAQWVLDTNAFILRWLQRISTERCRSSFCVVASRDGTRVPDTNIPSLSGTVTRLRKRRRSGISAWSLLFWSPRDFRGPKHYPQMVEEDCSATCWAKFRLPTPTRGMGQGEALPWERFARIWRAGVAEMLEQLHVRARGSGGRSVLLSARRDRQCSHLPGSSLPYTRPTPMERGRSRANSGQVSDNFGQHRPKFDRCEADFDWTSICLKRATMAPNVA